MTIYQNKTLLKLLKEQKKREWQAQLKASMRHIFSRLGTS